MAGEVRSLVDQAIAEHSAKRAAQAVALLKRWMAHCERDQHPSLIFRDKSGLGLHSTFVADDTREFLRWLQHPEE